jgi:hypothetical protein
MAFVASGTYVVPVGVSHLRVKVWGAGGGGATAGPCGGVCTDGGGGGGGGGYQARLLSVTPGQACDVHVGVGGGAGVFGSAGGEGSDGELSSVTCGVIEVKALGGGAAGGGSNGEPGLGGHAQNGYGVDGEDGMRGFSGGSTQSPGGCLPAGLQDDVRPAGCGGAGGSADGSHLAEFGTDGLVLIAAITG